MKRTFVAVALAVVFLLALAAPAIASSLTHSVTLEMDGVIDYKKQAGHECNTGGVLKQVIAGSGVLTKVMDITMIENKLTVSDTNDFVAGATPLTVTSVWELCLPPKYTIAQEDVYGNEWDIPVRLDGLYFFGSQPAYWDGERQQGITTEMIADREPAYDALTSQIWAVQVQADAGFSGSLHQKGEAANGGYWGFLDNPLGVGVFDSEDGWSDQKDTWRWQLNEGTLEVGLGADFVGNYFNMQQMARTSQGTLRRFIDISSPFSHAYLMQDMKVVGKSEVSEYFTMPNIAAGSDIVSDWWKLF